MNPSFLSSPNKKQKKGREFVLGQIFTFWPGKMDVVNKTHLEKRSFWSKLCLLWFFRGFFGSQLKILESCHC